MKRQDFILNKNLLLHEKVSIESLNNSFLKEPKKLIKFFENRYKEQIKELVDDFLTFKNKRIILLAGPSSSGKTTTSHLIRNTLKRKGFNTVTISLDDFYLPYDKRPLMPDGTRDNESIYSLDLKSINNFVKSILKHGKAKMPVFNFLTRSPEDEKVNIKVDSNTIIIFEGLHALNPDLFENSLSLAYRVYISPRTDFYLQNKLLLTSTQLRLMRRCIRDIYTRGTKIGSNLAGWKYVTESEDIYIKRYKETADYFVNSALVYELLLYAKYLKPLLMATEGSKQALQLIRVLDGCEHMDKKLVPPQSMLWEFLVYKDD